MRRFALLVLPSFLIACASEPETARAAASPTATPPPTAAPAVPAEPRGSTAAGSEREQEAPKSAAQVELEASAAEIEEQIEAIRGTQFRQPVAVKLSDKASLVAYLERRMALETTPERQRFNEEAAKLLGLIPPEMDLLAATKEFLEAQVGGFYDPPTKTFYVMESFGGDLARVIMSHEFVHALDDQLYDLDATLERLGDDTDRVAAFGAVCEGSGTLTMTQWALAHGTKLDPKALMELQKMTSQGMEDLPPYVWKPSLAAYLCGQSFLEKSVPKKSKKKKAEEAKDGAAAAAPVPSYAQQLERAFRDPPRSTEQILHPEKYWGEQTDEPTAIAFDTSALPAGWSVRGEDTFGELGLALLTEPRSERKGIRADDMFAVLAMKYTNDGAEGWDGDRLIVLERGDERILQLVTAWDTPEDAAQFAEVLREGGAAARIPLRGADGASKGRALQASSLDVETGTVEPGGIPCVTVVVRALKDDARDDAARSIALPWSAARADER
jgi:hypothetical protein